MTATAYERLVDVFRGEGLTVIERCHGKAIAQAPGHSPADRSVTITDIGGQVLVHSHSDPTDLVLDALRVRHADLFDDVRGVEYRYPDNRVVHRTPEKKFRQSGNTKGQSLYHADRLGEATVVYVCFADDTEVLTPHGWVILADLPTGIPVAQYAPARHLDHVGKVEFVVPVARQQFRYAGEMINIKTRWADTLVTPDHRMLTKWQTSAPVTIPAAELGQQRWYPVAGNLNGTDLVSCDDARLIAAWQADGVDTARGFRVGWNVKKDRKLTRIKQLLDVCGLAWKEQEFHSTPGWKYVSVDRRDHWALSDSQWKSLPWRMLGWASEARIAFIEELGHWDGDFSGRNGIRYFTADHQSAEVVSALAAVSGYGSILRRDWRPTRPEQGLQYVLNLSRRDWRSANKKPARAGYDGMVYCLTVPSGYVITRRNGKVMVAGNCEGEKDVHALESEGVVATCTAMGAGKAHLFDLTPLHGKTVRIIADKDTVGRAHANQVTELLAGKADVSIWEPASGKDAADHIAAGHTIDEFVAAQSAPPHGITAVLRKLLNLADTTPAEELLRLAYAELDALAAPASDDEPAIRKFDSITDEWWTWIDAPATDIRTIGTPWPSLDDLLAGGLHPGRSYLIAARPGAGKSLALTNIAAHAAEAGRKGLLFSLEMGRIEIASRIIAAGAGAEYGQITRRTIDAHNMAGIAEYLDRAHNMPLWVCDRAAVTVYQIRDAARRMSRTNGLDFVAVDYAQLLRPTDTRETRERQVADISRNLKILAKDLDIAVVTACQLNRAPAKEKRPPTIAELRESGALEQDSDVVILLHHNLIDDMPTGEIDVIVGKNRTGKLATVTLPWRAYRASIG